MLISLARTCYRRRGRVVLTWVVVAFVISSVGWGAVGPDFRTDFTLPDSETKEVFDFLEERSPEDAGFTGQIVFTTPAGVRDPAVVQAMEGLFAEVEQLEGVRVTSPYTEAGAFQVSDDETIAYAQLDMTDRPFEEFTSLGNDIQDLGEPISVEGLRIEYGGDIFYAFELPASELLGVLAAVIILMIAFGSVLAMGIPIGTALVGLLTSLAGVALVSNLQSMPDFTPAMAAMIALGVGIDYALFIVTRYREGLHTGLDPEAATVNALDSSGRAVLFAGGTVIISLLGLFFAGLDFVRGIAIAGALGVLVMMLAAVTLVPALLGFVRERIEVTRWRGALGLLVPVVLAIPAFLLDFMPLFLFGLLIGIGILVASIFVPRLRAQVPVRRHGPRERSFWYRWSRFIQHRPWPALAVSLIVLLTLAVPLFGIRLGFGDTGNYPEDETSRQAYDLLAEGFGPGSNGPLLLLVRGDGGNLQPDEAVRVSQAAAETEGVAAALPPRPLGDDAALVTVIPENSPQDEETSELVHRLRDDVIPATGVNAQVGGFSAANVDFSDFLARRLPIIVGIVLVLSFVLLMLVFRSLLVPLKAVIMNLLSIGAAYGVVVAVFQWGWGLGALGLDRAGPVEAWVPMMLFAIVFGLSMDYEVFLLTRMKEEFDRTGDNATAVADGLAITARVITAAALVMVCVFGSFVLGNDRQLKLFGLGLAVAVLIDATIVRMVLVPATMELLGDRNWWLPRFLDRILPKIHVEAHGPAPAPLPDEREPVKVGAGRD